MSKTEYSHLDLIQILYLVVSWRLSGTPHAPERLVHYQGFLHKTRETCSEDERKIGEIMGYGWINAEEISFNSFLLLDRWLIKMICSGSQGWSENFKHHFGVALKYNPAVAWYFINKSPETLEVVQRLIASTLEGAEAHQVRASEMYVISALETSVIYAFPEMMNEKCDYIYDWNKDSLFELADFEDKIVLDVGSGTGRLAFAAAQKARKVYASEPVDRLREFMRDKVRKEAIGNVVVLDGTIASIPFESDTFDIVMSGHVVGDDYDSEIKELERVVKDGGYIIDCIGDDNRKRQLNDELVSRGFEYFYHTSITGGDIYRYRKQVVKR